ncbi:hypothetical protein GCM10009828_102470 [Actinoplanes couchii]
MAQADLAAAVGKTQGRIPKVEKGGIEFDRAGLVNQIGGTPLPPE